MDFALGFEGSLKKSMLVKIDEVKVHTKRNMQSCIYRETHNKISKIMLIINEVQN